LTASICTDTWITDSEKLHNVVASGEAKTIKQLALGIGLVCISVLAYQTGKLAERKEVGYKMFRSFLYSAATIPIIK